MDERVGFDIGHSAAAVVPRRLRLRVRGLVQGVGFRPHVWRLATRNDLTGFAFNDQDGVLIEVQGEVDAFVSDLVAEAPPLARIDGVESEPCALVAGRERVRHPRKRTARPGAHRDHARRGDLRRVPRRVVRSGGSPLPLSVHHLHALRAALHGDAPLPYDRATTSLAEFPLCEACAAEYANPADRRFHAETTCCPACGPRLDTALDEIAARIRAGEIVALKGIGGFHLVCDARRKDTVARLRARKQPRRQTVRRHGDQCRDRLAASRRVDDESARLLAGRERPVVIVSGARRADGLRTAFPTDCRPSDCSCPTRHCIGW